MRKLSLFFILFFVFGNAQESKIIKLLNEALLEDIVLKSNHFTDDITIIQPYKIQNGILSVTLEYQDGNTHYIEKNEVPISKIKSIAKDINVLFLTNEKGVVTSRKNTNSQQEYESSVSQFFTGIRNKTNNEKLAKKLQKAFHKIGIPLKIEYWND